MEGFLRFCTNPPIPRTSSRTSKRNARAYYTHHSCRVRYSLFQTACKAVGSSIVRDGLVSAAEISDLWRWLGPQKSREHSQAEQWLGGAYLELYRQGNIVAPDRTILPPP